MANNKKGKNTTTLKSIGILFLYLFIWWIILTLIPIFLAIPESSVAYHLLAFLRITVPIMVVLFGCPIILIVNTNKKMKSKK